jgi:lantibiotic modifying enzyme
LVKELAEERLRAIAEAVAFRIEQEPDPGLLTGLAGQALFLYAYGRTLESDRYENLGFLALERTLRMVEKGFSWPSFASGLAGIRWALHYLAAQQFIRPADATALDGIGPYLQNFADERFAAGDYDVLHGGLGMFMTADGGPQKEDRRPQTADQGERKKAKGERKIKEQRLGAYHTSTCPLFHTLQKLSVPTADGLAWLSKNPKTDIPEINLGLAHGLPSILLLLSQELISDRREPISERSEPLSDRREPFNLLEKGIKFLLSTKLDKSTNGSLFAHRMIDGKPDQPGRLAWCYGDPGVGQALWQIGVNCGRADWQEEATEILRRAAKRTDARANRVYDACLCHGTAGLALLFYKMGMLTGHEELLDAAAHWMRATLDHGLNSGGSAGYLYLTTGNRYVSNYSLLEGISGTGLAILSLLEPEAMGWEGGMMM